MAGWKAENKLNCIAVNNTAKSGLSRCGSLQTHSREKAVIWHMQVFNSIGVKAHTSEWLLHETMSL